MTGRPGHGSLVRMTRATAHELLVPDSPIPGLTERERRFAVAYFEVSLETGRDLGCELLAYRRAFPSAAADDAQAHRLAAQLRKTPAVRNLVQLLRENYSQRAAMPPDHLIELLETQASARITDFCRVDPDTGGMILDLRIADPQKLAAIREMTVQEREKLDPDGNVQFVQRKTTIKLYDAQNAISMLSKIHGLIRSDDVPLTLDEVRRTLSRMRRQLSLPEPAEPEAAE